MVYEKPHGEQAASSVLLVCASEKGTAFFRQLLPPARFCLPVTVGSAGEARRLLADTSFDLVLINAPLPDEFGAQLAVDADHRYGCGALLLVRAEQYEQVMYKLEATGVLCLSRPCGGQTVYQALRLLLSTRQRLDSLQQKNQTLQSKMEEIRLVNRAKWLLIERFQMDEAQAHRAIEKQAMDTRSTRRQVAETIIKMYENM